MKNEKKDLIVTTDLKIPEMMINYLKGNNSELHQHKTEDILMSDAFTSDALEGLYGKLNNQELNKVQNELNNFIRHRIKNQKNKSKQTLSFPLWIILLMLVLLLISLAGYLVVRFKLNAH